MSVDDTLHPFPSDLILEASDNQEEFEELTRMLNLIQQRVDEDGLSNILGDTWEEEYSFARSDERVFLTIPRGTWDQLLTDVFNSNTDPLVHRNDWWKIKEIHREFMEQNSEYRSNEWTKSDEEPIPSHYEALVVNL